VAQSIGNDVKAGKKPFNYNFNYEPFKYKNFKYNGDFNYKKPKPDDATTAAEAEAAPIAARDEEAVAQAADGDVKAAKKPFNYNFNYEPFKYKNFKYNGDFNYRKPKPEDGAIIQDNEAPEAPVQKREEAGEVVAQDEDASAAKAKPFNYGFNYEPFKYKNFKYGGNFNYKKPKPEDGAATEDVKEGEEQTA
jgi:hypothetical protein